VFFAAFPSEADLAAARARLGPALRVPAPQILDLEPTARSAYR
jgi:hypothetical protein